MLAPAAHNVKTPGLCEGRQARGNAIVFSWFIYLSAQENRPLRKQRAGQQIRYSAEIR